MREFPKASEVSVNVSVARQASEQAPEMPPTTTTTPAPVFRPPPSPAPTSVEPSTPTFEAVITSLVLWLRSSLEVSLVTQNLYEFVILYTFVIGIC